MAKFFYRAIDDAGNPVTGELDVDSVETANSTLLARGYIPTNVSARSTTTLSDILQVLKNRITPIKTTELIIFTKQFRTMLRAGVSIVKLLQVLQNQTENQNLQSIIGKMAQDIKEGASLFEAFRKYPKTFTPLYCSMIQAGEASGALPDVLDRLIYITEHEHKVKSDIKAALQYPVIVIMFLVIAFFILLTFVIPKFIQIFANAGLALPLPTQICLYLYNALSTYWSVMLIGGSIIAVGLNIYLKTEPGKYLLHLFFMKIPLVGPLFVKAAMSRFASIFAILQSSGVAILESMRILHGTINNIPIARELEGITERLEEGRGIAAPLGATKHFPPMVVNMVAIGEEAGNLDEMLNEISVHYDDELEYTIKKLSEMIGPLLTVGLAGVVGFFALAIFLPMWDLTKMVK